MIYVVFIAHISKFIEIVKSMKIHLEVYKNESLFKQIHIGSFREKTELLYCNTFIDFGWISVGKKNGHDIVLQYLQTCQTVFAQSLKSLQHETMKLVLFL